MEISFQRAIKVDSTTNDRNNWKEHKVDSATMAVISTMKSRRTSIYDKNTSRKIGTFLRAQIGDYNSKTGVYVRKVEGEVCLYTGEDAKKAREIVATAERQRDALEKRYKLGPNSSMKLSEQVELGSKQLYRILKQNIYFERDKALLAMLENELYNPKKMNTTLRFTMDDNQKLKEIFYSCGKKTKDGYSTEKVSLTI